MTPSNSVKSKNEAIVKPEILKWARENAGFSLEQAAKKIAVKPEKLLASETGKERLTIRQLRSLSNAYKRPLAFFYLPSPPAQEQAVHDFRRLPEETDRLESPDLRLEIRRARYRRQIALELYDELGVAPPKFEARTVTFADSESMAQTIRHLLGIDPIRQFALKNQYEIFNFWRTALEKAGVLVFQAAGVELSEARGVSLIESPLPIILVNIKDSPLGRVFTLLHEFSHLMLRSPGLCDLQGEEQTEIFCNAVAGAALVPKELLQAEASVVECVAPNDLKDEEIIFLSSKYGVSREVVLRRLLTLGKITQDFYRKKRQEFQKEYDAHNRKDGFAPPDVMAVSTAGKLFVGLVLESYRQEKITSNDVATYLGVRLKHLSKIEKAVQTSEFELGAAA